jgi:hypothetical protein
MASVAVVILNYNGRHHLQQFLPSVIQHSGRAEVIIADNDSTDGSKEFLEKSFPDIRIIHFDKNHGFAGGYNKALRQVATDYYILLNSDVEVTDNWVDPLISFLENHPDYAACQPKIRDYHQRHYFEYAGASGGFLDRLGYPFCRGRVFDHVEKDKGQYDNVTDIFWASGACMVIRSKAFHEQNGFDVDFFAHMEEIDLAWRMQNTGSKIAVVPNSVVYHVGGGTLSKQSAFKTYLNFRNGMDLLLKNLPTNELFWKIPFRFILDWVAAFRFIFQSDAKHSRAILRAHWHSIKSIKRTLKKRKGRYGARLFKGLIIVEYFLKRRKTYQSIVPEPIVSPSQPSSEIHRKSQGEVDNYR